MAALPRLSGVPSLVLLFSCMLLLLLLHAPAARAFESAPAGRTAIKINAERAASASSSSYDYEDYTPPASGGARAGYARWTPPSDQPVLHRQPHAVTPPPWIRTAQAEGTASVEESDALPVPHADDASIPQSAVGVDSDDAATHPSPVSLWVNPGWSSSALGWSSLSGSCWSYSTSAYTYSYCPYQNVTQKSTSSTLHVVLGVWDEWRMEQEEDGEGDAGAPVELGEAASTAASTDDPTTSAIPHAPSTPIRAAGDSAPALAGASSPRLVHWLSDGTACASGKRRSTRVLFYCEADERQTRLSDVAEPRTCEYTFRFHTNLVCTQAQMQAHEATGRQGQHPPPASASATVDAMQACIDALMDEAGAVSGADRDARPSASLCQPFVRARTGTPQEAAAAARPATPAAATTVGVRDPRSAASPILHAAADADVAAPVSVDGSDESEADLRVELD